MLHFCFVYLCILRTETSSTCDTSIENKGSVTLFATELGTIRLAVTEQIIVHLIGFNAQSVITRLNDKDDGRTLRSDIIKIEFADAIAMYTSCYSHIQ